MGHNKNMLVFIRILFFVYIFAVNAYGFILVKLKSDDLSGGEKSGYGKIIIAALLGGAVGAYVGIFVNKYGLDNIILMVFLPVIAVINIFILWQLYVNNFLFFGERTILSAFYNLPIIINYSTPFFFKSFSILSIVPSSFLW